MLNQRGNILPIIGIFVILVVVGAGSYYFGLQNSSSSKIDMSSTIVEQSTSSPTASASAVVNQNIPKDWQYVKDDNCLVQIPLPPKQPPFMETENNITWFWQIERGQKSQYFDIEFENNVSAHYFNDKELGSGYVAGIVQIRCGQNKNLTTQAYADSLFQSLKNIKMYMGESVSCNPTQSKMSLWQKDVIAVSQNCSSSALTELPNMTFYVFADQDFVYAINKESQSKNPLVKQTTDQIFNNLKFSN